MSETTFRITERPEDFKEYEEAIMSNFDHLIDREVEAAIKGNKFYADYPGWNFNAKVWWNSQINQWVCQVWQYHSVVQYVVEDTLEEIKETVCDKYGSD